MKLPDFPWLGALIVSLVINVIVVVGVLSMTEPPLSSQIENLTYSTTTDTQRKENRGSWNKWDVIATASVFGLALAMYLYFSF